MGARVSVHSLLRLLTQSEVFRLWFSPDSLFLSRLQLNVEDPCIICHEDMNPDDMRVLDCRHSFHNEVSNAAELETKWEERGLVVG